MNKTSLPTDRCQEAIRHMDTALRELTSAICKLPRGRAAPVQMAHNIASGLKRMIERGAGSAQGSWKGVHTSIQETADDCEDHAWAWCVTCDGAVRTGTAATYQAAAAAVGKSIPEIHMEEAA
jgi:flavin-binding protein dodecin